MGFSGQKCYVTWFWLPKSLYCSNPVLHHNVIAKIKCSEMGKGDTVSEGGDFSPILLCLQLLVSYYIISTWWMDLKWTWFDSELDFNLTLIVWPKSCTEPVGNGLNNAELWLLAKSRKHESKRILLCFQFPAAFRAVTWIDNFSRGRSQLKQWIGSLCRAHSQREVQTSSTWSSGSDPEVIVILIGL